MDLEFRVHGKIHEISIEHKDGRVVATLDGNRMELDVHHVSPQAVSLLLNDRSYLAHVARSGKKIYVAVRGSQFCLEIPEQESTLTQLKQGASEQVEGTIKAPMPGLVIKVNVLEGAEVNRGDSLVVVEAMKMEHEMRAPFRATVAKVYVRASQQVDAFQPLVDLQPAGDSTH